MPDPKRTGGDAFDLADVKVTRARFVRIRDLSSSGSGTSAGFDLDAAGLIHDVAPNAEIHMPKTGHASFWDDAATFNRCLRAFVSAARG